MHRTKVESSNVESVGFDRIEGVLEVEFKSGKVYQYTGVKSEEYAELLASKSKGGYLARNFVQGGRAYTRMEEENADKDAD